MAQIFEEYVLSGKLKLLKDERQKQQNYEDDLAKLQQNLKSLTI